MRLLPLILLFLHPFLTPAQNISGRWEGNYNGLGVSQPEKVVIELSVYHDSLLSGTSHLIYASGEYEHYTVHGKYRKRDSTIFLSEDSTIAVRATFRTVPGDYSMKLKIKNNKMRFEGRWRENTPGFVLFRVMSGAWFEKQLPPPPRPVTVATQAPKPRRDRIASLNATTPPAQKPGVTLTKPLSTTAPSPPPPDRKSSVQKMIEINYEERDSIKIELKDNAQIDNDVVSVYMDDRLVLGKQKLTASPATFYFSLKNALDICTIKMIAESMGSVPPCTALMVVTTKKNRYEVTLSSDFGNNGELKLFLKR